MIPAQIPLRVDFAGGWLDVPRLARQGAFIVNCAIQPLVSLDNWPYQKGGGLGGSAAWAILNGKDGVNSELDLGVGWQDPAVIQETGLCVWRSGPRPVLEFKANPSWLDGLMALEWLGNEHNTPSHADTPRDYDLIARAGWQAHYAVTFPIVESLAKAVRLSYDVQLREGMPELPEHGQTARKYCGGGWGGYALYLFANREKRDAAGLIQIEPYMRDIGD